MFGSSKENVSFCVFFCFTYASPQDVHVTNEDDTRWHVEKDIVISEHGDEDVDEMGEIEITCHSHVLRKGERDTRLLCSYSFISNEQ